MAVIGIKLKASAEAATRAAAMFAHPDNIFLIFGRSDSMRNCNLNQEEFL